MRPSLGCTLVLAVPFLAACPDIETDSGGAAGIGTPAPLFQTHPPARSKPANVVGGFSIDVPKETLAPGEEKEPCYIFPLEIQGPSHIVGGARLTVGTGMHHGNIVTRPKTGEGIRPCPPDDGNGQIVGEAD